MMRIFKNTTTVLVIWHFFMVLLCLSACHPEMGLKEPPTSFIKFYGGEREQKANNIQETRDGGYILVGTTDSETGDSNVYVVKTTKEGELHWEKTYKGSKGVKIHELKDSTGYLILVHDGENVNLIKIKKEGEFDSEKMLSRQFFQTFRPFDMIVVDNTILITGNSRSNKNSILYSEIEFDDFMSMPMSIPNEIFGFQDSSITGYSVAKDTGTAVILASIPYVMSSDVVDSTYLFKPSTGSLDSRQHILKQYKNIVPKAIKSYSDGFVILATNEDTQDTLIVATLNHQFGSPKYYEYPNAKAGGIDIVNNGDDGFIISGTLSTGDGRILMIKVKKDLSEEWVKTFGNGEEGEGTDVLYDSDDESFVLTGSSTFLNENKMMTLIKTDMNGEFKE